MLNKIIQLSKDSIVYGFGTVAGKVISLLLLPVYTRFFSPADYGAIDLITVSFGLVSIIASLDLYYGMMRYYYEAKTDREQKIVISTGLITIVILAFLPIIFIEYFAQDISNLLFGKTCYAFIIRLAVLGIPVDIIMTYMITLFRVKRVVRLFTVITIVNLSLNGVIGVLAIVVFKSGIIGYFMAQIISGSISIIIALKYSIRWFGFAFNKNILVKEISFSAPLVLSGIANWVNNYCSRFILLGIFGIEQVGIYSLAVKMGSIVLLVNSAFGMAWTPFAWSLIKEQGHQNIFAKVLNIYLLLVIGLGSVIVLFSDEIVRLIAPVQYRSASTVIGFLICANMLQGLAPILGVGLGIMKKSVLNAICFALGSLSVLVITYPLASVMGPSGAALAVVFGAVITAVAFERSTQKYYPVPFELKTIVKAILLFASVMIASYMLNKIHCFALKLILKTVSLILLEIGVVAICIKLQEIVSFYKLFQVWLSGRSAANNVLVK